MCKIRNLVANYGISRETIRRLVHAARFGLQAFFEQIGHVDTGGSSFAPDIGILALVGFLILCIGQWQSKPER